MSEAAKKRFFRLVEITKTAPLPQADQALTEALRTTPKDPNILHLAAQTAENIGDYDRALLLYKRAMAAHPDWFEATMNYCRLLSLKSDYGLAIETLRYLETKHPQRLEIPESIARFSQSSGNLPQAISYWRTVVTSAPAYTEGWGQYYFCLKQVCDWSEQPSKDKLFSPQLTTIFFDDPDLQRKHAEAYCQKRYSSILPLPAVANYFHEKCRIGYLSSDFHAHATSRLIAELFTLHDRSRFEVYAYSYGIEDHSPIRARLREEADHFIELNSLTPQQCAQRIRADEIDILIDLKGHTHGSRLDILAFCPAPIQLHWLGFPATTGAAFLNGFIADPITVPKGAESGFTETVYRMPHSYQINDREKNVAPPKDKVEYGLPATSFILASFNQTYKITPEIFSIWCDILKETPEAVLWLYESNSYAIENLQREAQQRGVDPSRLFFAKPLPQEEHLARYHVVDIALDTFPVGGHTTTSDALWVGAPVITLAGEGFVSRVAASLLSAVNLGYLITTSPEQYKSEITKLIKDDEKRGEIRNQLRMKKMILPLFDTPLFVNAFEKLILSIT